MLVLRLSICMLLISCSTFEVENKISQDRIEITPPTLYVELSSPLVRTSFSEKRFISGILKAKEKVILKAKTNGNLSDLLIEEGQVVELNSLIAKIDENHFLLELKKVKNRLDKAKIKKKDLIIRYKGEDSNSDSLSPQVLKNIDILSGYNESMQAIDRVKFEIDKTNIIAPFNGVISDLEVSPFQVVNLNDIICTLINLESFEAVFWLTEFEAINIKIGQRVILNPAVLPDKKLKAIVNRINPVVNKQGLIKVYAKIINDSKLKLLDGMSIQLSLERLIPNKLLVPKEAVLLRSGRQVVFTYDKDSQLAKWNYIKTKFENDKHYAVEEGLEEGDIVLIDGHVNLGHDAIVKIRK